MNGIIELCGYFAIVFAVSVGASYLLLTIRLKRKNAPILPNATLQLRSGEGVYRCRYLGTNASGWVISSPISRDAYVPLRVGESVAVIAPTEKGLKHFVSEIVLRDSESHELTLKVSDRMTSAERRDGHRLDKFLTPSASIDGKAATLLDLSESGARLITSEPFRRGDRAGLALPHKGTVFGWILESSPANPGYVLRLRFEEPLTEERL